jgi:transcriptional regulator with PAS, ATPase and Fis domain
MQSKLLRVIQEKEVMRVGGTQMTPFDARIIVATNRNLWKLVCENRFREDLYYRLSVLEINIPSLRERREDITPLFL